MSGVIIKDIMMPTNCYDCPCGYLAEGSYFCQPKGYVWKIYGFTHCRPDWCPLIEVKEDQNA